MSRYEALVDFEFHNQYHRKGEQFEVDNEFIEADAREFVDHGILRAVGESENDVRAGESVTEDETVSNDNETDEELTGAQQLAAKRRKRSVDEN